MKQLFCTVAVLISLLSPAFVNTIPIGPNGNEDYLDACGNYSLTLQLTDSTVIRKYLISSPIIRCLKLEGGAIETIDNGAFDQMPNLLYLNLQGNRISTRNLFSFGNLLSVRKLVLSNQNWGYYTDDAVIGSVYPQLQYLDLKNIGISGIQYTSINPFPELTYLDLSTNRMRNFNSVRSLSPKLTHLYINDNQLSEFSLTEYPDLISLALENNQFSIIGRYGLKLDGLTNLKNLSVANNQIQDIRLNAFESTVRLRHLNISKNSLSYLEPEVFKNQFSLEVLVLDQNNFEDVPIALPLNITTLSMNCNRLKNITINSLYNLSQLRTLSLAGNMIANIHMDAFQNQGMLEELYLYNNELDFLPTHWCREMKYLRYLDLSGNKFRFLESALSKVEWPTLPSLQQLYFEHNPLKSINASTLATVLDSVTIYLDTQSERTTVKCKSHSSYEITTESSEYT